MAILSDEQLERAAAAAPGELSGLAALLGVNYNTLRREVGEYKRRKGRPVRPAPTLDLVDETTGTIVEFIPPAWSKLEPVVPTELVLGAVGDTHLCSRYERLDLLEQLYDYFAAAGVATVYHTGNYIDGEARFNFNDIHTHGLDNQVRYFVEKYPARPGIVTRFIAGDDHEGWYVQRLGVDIGKRTEQTAKEAGRTDLEYLGYMEVDVRLTPAATLRVLHPGGGSAAAISAASQKVVEAWEREDRPDVVFMGHYHKAHFLPDYRGVAVLQTGCMVEQSPFMRKKRLGADLGGWVVRIRFDPAGKIATVAAEWIGFRPKRWSYQMLSAVKGSQ